MQSKEQSLSSAHGIMASVTEGKYKGFLSFFAHLCFANNHSYTNDDNRERSNLLSSSYGMLKPYLELILFNIGSTDKCMKTKYTTKYLSNNFPLWRHPSEFKISIFFYLTVQFLIHDF